MPPEEAVKFIRRKDYTGYEPDDFEIYDREANREFASFITRVRQRNQAFLSRMSYFDMIMNEVNGPE